MHANRELWSCESPFYGSCLSRSTDILIFFLALSLSPPVRKGLEAFYTFPFLLSFFCGVCEARGCLAAGLGQDVFISLLKCDYCLGHFVDTKAVRSLPVAFLVAVADFQDYLWQRHRFALVLDDVLEYGCSHSPHFEDDFRFGHFSGISVIPPIDWIYQFDTIDKTIHFINLSAPKDC